MPSAKRPLPPEKRAELMSRRWLLLSDFARLMAKDDVVIQTLRRWAANGRLPASRRLGHRWWIDMKELKSWRTDESLNLLSGSDDDVHE